MTIAQSDNMHAPIGDSLSPQESKMSDV